VQELRLAGGLESPNERGNEMTIEELHRIADQHIGRFTSMLSRVRSGATNIRAHECEPYLAIWRGVRLAQSLDELTPLQRGELIDYCMSEDLPNPFSEVKFCEVCHERIEDPQHGAGFCDQVEP
jgi:hypothetical protein